MYSDTILFAGELKRGLRGSSQSRVGVLAKPDADVDCAVQAFPHPGRRTRSLQRLRYRSQRAAVAAAVGELKQHYGLLSAGSVLASAWQVPAKFFGFRLTLSTPAKFGNK